jgi:hypothetical protein
MHPCYRAIPFPRPSASPRHRRGSAKQEKEGRPDEARAHHPTYHAGAVPGRVGIIPLTVETEKTR